MAESKMEEFSLSEANKLNIYQTHLEKSIYSVLLLLKKYDYDLLEYFDEINENCHADKENIQRKLSEIHNSIKTKRELLKNDRIADITNLKQFKKDMVLIQDTIQNLKAESKIKMTQLNREDFQLSEDLHYYNNKIIEWSKPVQLNIYCNLEPLKPKSLRTKHHCKEVKAFLDFVHISGGHENGWRKEDHQLFIKFRKKYKDINSLAHKLHETLPDISIEDIKDHEEWFKKYKTLEKNKRNAIETWKRSKAHPSTTVVDQNSKMASLLSPVMKREDIQEQLMKFKREKEIKMQNAKDIDLYHQQRRREEEEIKRKRNEEMKKIVQEWKDIKFASEQKVKFQKMLLEENEKKIRALEANKLIKQFQSQDDMYIAKMKQLKKREEWALPCRSKSGYVAKKDPARLLRPTKQWISRVHDDKVYCSPFLNASVPVNKLPKLRVPEWRVKNE